MTDRLTLAHALEEGGIARDAAEHNATEILDAIHDNVATKADVAVVRTEVAAVRTGEGFRMPAPSTYPAVLRAGVRKPPRKEPAGAGRAASSLWGFNGAA